MHGLSSLNHFIVNASFYLSIFITFWVSTICVVSLFTKYFSRDIIKTAIWTFVAFSPSFAVVAFGHYNPNWIIPYPLWVLSFLSIVAAVMIVVNSINRYFEVEPTENQSPAISGWLIIMIPIFSVIMFAVSLSVDNGRFIFAYPPAVMMFMTLIVVVLQFQHINKTRTPTAERQAIE